jgi:para-aminobenzoate synthetase component 1
VKHIISEFKTSLSASDCFERLKDDNYAFFLDSGMGKEKLGRFSFLGSHPFMVMKSRGKTVHLSGTDIQSQIIQADPFDVLPDLLVKYSYETGSTGIPFSGGVVGYFSYDLGRLIEKLPEIAVDDLGLPECYLAFYDSVIAFDHLKGKQYLCTGSDAGIEKLREVISRAAPVTANESSSVNKKLELKSNFSHEEYIRAVERTREYILDGDIFQANISQRFEAPLTIPPYELYRRLRNINPAPFAAYLNFEEVKVISASPERFLRLEGELIQTRPIKGTRPRGRTTTEDERLAGELLESVKDHAENIMIVDLERNDLGRVSNYGSVKVTELAALERYATVFHLTSTVEGKLKAGKDRIDLLRATFPGGSISGAPKVRAMEIIEALEPNRRSVYTGAIGYLGFDGGMDLNIAIRTILAVGEKAYFQVGGGIVYDSEPEAEYRETLDKAKALIAALDLSNETQSEGLR